jgi:dTDP-glucose 4,6-dehydratase
MAYYKTYQLPVTLSNCSNNYGPFQFPEKLIPLFVTNLMLDKPIPLYRESQNKREWLHVDDHNRAIELILKSGKAGEAYNIGSGIEKSVEEISDILLKKFNKAADRYKTYVPSRPSHDRRYFLDSSKIRTELGWGPKISFEDGLDLTVDWYIHHRAWWEKLLGRSPVSELEWKR